MKLQEQKDGDQQRAILGLVQLGCTDVIEGSTRVLVPTTKDCDRHFAYQAVGEKNGGGGAGGEDPRETTHIEKVAETKERHRDKRTRR